jgi:hypothetical protein
MEAKNIRNLNINTNINLIHIRRRNGTQNSSPMPPDPKGKRKEKGRNAHTVTKDYILNLHACKNKISNDSNTSEKQPWRSHSRGCQEEEARRSKFQERE